MIKIFCDGVTEISFHSCGKPACQQLAHVAGIMAVRFQVTSEAYSCILEKLSKYSAAYGCLVRAVSGKRLGEGAEVPYIKITCSKREARRLLSVAKEHCPDAAPVIEEAIRHA